MHKLLSSGLNRSLISSTSSLTSRRITQISHDLPVRNLSSLHTVPTSKNFINSTRTFSKNFGIRSFSELSESNHQQRNNEDIIKKKKFRKWRRRAIVVGVLLVGGAIVGYLTMDWEEHPLPGNYPGDVKPRVVVLGSGWGSLAVIQEIDTRYYDVVLVSPRNYFLFTPLLPSVTVGTIDPRSVTEPIRKYCFRNGANITYYEAACEGVDVQNNTIKCKSKQGLDGVADAVFDLKYDHLVVSVGAINNTFGTPGVYEHCQFLKEMEDAKTIRKKIIDCFETARLPSTTAEERNRLLHFVVVGGGPNGVEFAAELRDFVTDNLTRWFPDLVPQVQITLLELADHILNMYDAQISDYTEKHFKRTDIDVRIKSAVTAVNDKAVVIRKTDTNEIVNIPYGLCVWSTGIGPSPLVEVVRNQLTSTQTNRRAILTDGYLQVKGTNNVYALGDCATIEPVRLLGKFVELFKEADVGGRGYLTIDDFQRLFNKISRQYPQFQSYGKKVKQLFIEADVNKDQQLSLEEFKGILTKVDGSLKILPATAQVASQQGTYLGRQFNEKGLGLELTPFRYQHFGSFAYIGSENAVADFSNHTFNLHLPSTYSGIGAWWLWRSIYLSKQFSVRNKILVSFDWLKTSIFGRDITRN